MPSQNVIMSENTELTLNNFFIYNDTYGHKEGEEDQKIMYFYPMRTSLDVKMRNVGLSEAIIKFMDNFNPSQPCESLNTEKTRQLYYQPEDHFWMVMTVNVPTRTTVEGRTYHGEEVQDTICLAVLKQSYVMARLFIGLFTDLLKQKEDTSLLKEKLEHFFNRYLKSLKLHHCDILDVFQGVQFLPLDKQTFLRVQCFVNLVEATFSQIEFSAFLYNERLIWSGLEPDDMQAVFQYLVTTLLPAFSETELLQGSAIPQHSTAVSNYGRFVTGPDNIHNSNSNIGKIPRFYISKAQPPGMYQLVVYRSLSATVCLFVEESIQLTIDMFRQWDAFMGPRLTKLVNEVSAYAGRHIAFSTPSEGCSRFVYFNRMNLATKSTVHLDNRRTGNVVVTPQVLKILADINADHRRMTEAGCSTAETIVKTLSESHWVVGKLSNAREFYVVIQHKNTNLTEINDEVKKICETELKSIFFHV